MRCGRLVLGEVEAGATVVEEEFVVRGDDGCGFHPYCLRWGGCVGAIWVWRYWGRGEDAVKSESFLLFSREGIDGRCDCVRAGHGSLGAFLPEIVFIPCIAVAPTSIEEKAFACGFTLFKPYNVLATDSAGVMEGWKEATNIREAGANWECCRASKNPSLGLETGDVSTLPAPQDIDPKIPPCPFAVVLVRLRVFGTIVGSTLRMSRAGGKLEGYGRGDGESWGHTLRDLPLVLGGGVFAEDLSSLGVMGLSTPGSGSGGASVGAGARVLRGWDSGGEGSLGGGLEGRKLD